MGFFSYNCKECGHPLLSREATDPGINVWMSQGVILTPRGSIIFGEYDGYGRCGEAEDIDNCACLHRACWEVAGKPDWKHYGSPSDGARDQGFFFNDGDHDLIDPRITEGRDELLAKGIEARKARRLDSKAAEVYDMVHDNIEGHRFGYGRCYEAGEPIENKFYLTDRFREKFEKDDESAYFMGTEAEVKAHCQKLWDEFVTTDECKTLLAHHEARMKVQRLAYEAKLRAEGRFEVSFVKPRGSHPVYEVFDKLNYEAVGKFESEPEAKTEAARLEATW